MYSRTSSSCMPKITTDEPPLRSISSTTSAGSFPSASATAAMGLPLLAGILDQGDGVGGLVPGPPPGAFDVRDVNRQPGVAADFQRLFHGDQQAGSLVAHVAGVEAAVFGRHLGQGDDLVSLRVS